MIGTPGPIPAQGLTGLISGTVTHATGAMPLGVTVAIKNVGNGRPHVLVLDCSYDVPDLGRK